MKKQIVNKTLALGNNFKREYQLNKKGDNTDRWHLLAYIFALWTIIKAQSDD
jgi:hypothetical protein